MRLSVLGTGSLGATHAACLAAGGHEVVGVDTDGSRIAALEQGVPPFHEPGLVEVLRTGLAKGRLRFSTDVAAAADSDAHFLCVGTPQLPGSHAADLGALWQAVEALAPLLQRPCVVIGKSTVPVGTAAGLREVLHRASPAGEEVHVAWNPEFLREGHAVEDSLHPDRLVLGVESEHAYGVL